MENTPKKFDQFVTKVILTDKEYSFTDVNELQCLKSIQFDFEHYSSVKKLIEEGKWEQVEEVQEQTGELRMYLIIVRFKNQNGKTFIATIYDSDALEQDPQIIDIFSQ